MEFLDSSPAKACRTKAGEYKLLRRDSIMLMMDILQLQGLEKFVKYADMEDSMPRPSRRTPKYSAYKFPKEEWELINLIIEALKV